MGAKKAKKNEWSPAQKRKASAISAAFGGNTGVKTQAQRQIEERRKMMEKNANSSKREKARSRGL